MLKRRRFQSLEESANSKLDMEMLVPGNSAQGVIAMFVVGLRFQLRSGAANAFCWVTLLHELQGFQELD